MLPRIAVRRPRFAPFRPIPVPGETMATALIGKTPLTIDSETFQKNKDHLAGVFAKTRCKDHIATLLTSAGLGEGRWLVRIMDQLKVSGATPPMRVRRAERDGVRIDFKLGDNGTGVHCLLVVTKDRGTPEEVFRRLHDAHQAGHLGDAPRLAALPKPVAVPAPLANELLGAVSRLSDTYWPDLDSFLAALYADLPVGTVETAADLLELLEALVDQDLMTDHKTSYAPSLNGQARLDALPPPVGEAGPPVPLPALPLAAVTLPVSSPAGGQPNDDIVGLIEKNMARLQQLLDLPKLVAASRAKQRQLEADIRKETTEFQARVAKLTKELQGEFVKEQALVKTCDADAVRLLLES